MKTKTPSFLENEKGFTLLELMVSCFIMTILFSSVFAVLMMANQVFKNNDLYSRLNQNDVQILRSISREIGQSSPNASPSHIAITANGSNNTVRFQIPVDWDNDGDADTGGAKPAIEWGAYGTPGEKTNGLLNYWIQYSLSNNQLVRSVLDASLNTVTQYTRIIANDVQTFTVSQNVNIVTMTISFSVSGTVGQNSNQLRTLTQSFSNVTILRNAVN